MIIFTLQYNKFNLSPQSKSAFLRYSNLYFCGISSGTFTVKPRNLFRQHQYKSYFCSV